MRLLNTKTYLFEEFIGSNIPEYAILSHTWGTEEVSFNDMADPSRSSKRGNQKIEMTCQLASQANISYAWIDTCCIDKSSSAELTEAINSMFRWYQRSKICLVFFEDLPPSASLEAALPHCRWFSRGWTLQELIAPENIGFYDQDWNYRGTKQELSKDLSRITGVSEGVLLHSVSLSSLAVAQKMSWAAHRETTRIEDTAYCLLGIFNVNMALLYGEEGNAFRRLQEEIIKLTPDFSILAWELPRSSSAVKEPQPRIVCGVLAESPVAFGTMKTTVRETSYEQQEFSVSNIGIKSRIRLVPEIVPGKLGARSILPLDCSRVSGRILGIALRKYGKDQWVREDPFNLVEDTDSLFDTRSAPEESYLLTKLLEMGLRTASGFLDMNAFLAQIRSRVLQIRLPPGMYALDTLPHSRFDGEDSLFFVSEPSRTLSGVVKLEIYGPMSLQGYNDVNVHFGCTFYAVNWSSLEPSLLQCTLVNSRLYIEAIEKVHSQNKEWDYDSDHTLKALVDNKIPKSPFFSFWILRTSLYVLVSYTTSLVNDPEICQGKFWRVEFSYQLCNVKSLPEVQPEDWSLDLKGLSLRH